ncbi:sirohydrochlorin chelatase [Paenibacillus sp. GCM10012307]|uniref:Cobalamin biosynthesis protein CbiX n=1 Tax=Paenibacillus roseus TaxID=2798579 RepID=A0A934IXP9_9BACL|nr:CbiX/SirB N-terminal domain-containing protein [Paenibacillus roseus]MBJ6361186.1 cobalamin biosynthesis protein CbiX [Paenibacillus roseus]
MQPGILVISHGSREEAWVKLVDEAVARIKLTRPVPVVSAFLEIVEGRLIQDGIDQLEAEGVTDMYVLPLFVSSGSTHVDDIGQGFGEPRVSPDREGELATFAIRTARVEYGQPIDNDPFIAELLYENIRELSEQPEQEELLLIGHGSREKIFHGRWRDGLAQLAERVRELGGFAGARTAMLLPNQAACVLRAMNNKAPQRAVLVVPLFLSKGYFTNKVIPTRLDGLEYRYNGRTLLPHPFVTRWMEQQIEEWLERIAAGEHAVAEVEAEH